MLWQQKANLRTVTSSSLARTKASSVRHSWTVSGARVLQSRLEETTEKDLMISRAWLIKYVD
jgi:hypothetical protein